MDSRLYIWPRYVLESCGRQIELTPLQGVILSRLQSGRCCSFNELAESLYGHREDGGPLDPDNIIAVTICRLRKKLRQTSLSIKRVRVGHYRLTEKLGATVDGISDTILAEGKTTKPD